jgi:phosphate starvation-inducible PhoH-like protein
VARKKKKLNNYDRPEPTTDKLILKKSYISAKSPEQKEYLRKIKDCKMVFCAGRAGTGKTCVAVASGILAVAKGHYEKLVITRPMVQAGEDTGALPGGISEKLRPYLEPIYDELHEFISYADIQRMIVANKIQIVPFAYMRGRTLKEAYIVADECQNCTYDQIKMVCTRIGEGSKLILTGDTKQSDLDKHKQGGFETHLDIIGEGRHGITTVYLYGMVRAQVVSDYLDIMEGEEEDEDSTSTYIELER